MGDIVLWLVAVPVTLFLIYMTSRLVFDAWHHSKLEYMLKLVGRSTGKDKKDKKKDEKQGS